MATVWDFTDIRQRVLHRMSAARLLEESAQEPKGFDLSEYIRQGGFDYSSGEKIELVARFDAYDGKALLETPLTPAQAHETLDDGSIEVCAIVNDSQQLRWWFMGFGSGVEVVSPRHLRDEVRKDSEILMSLYKKS